MKVDSKDIQLHNLKYQDQLKQNPEFIFKPRIKTLSYFQKNIWYCFRYRCRFWLCIYMVSEKLGCEKNNQFRKFKNSCRKPNPQQYKVS